MKSDMMLAAMQLAAERDLPLPSVVGVVEEAIASAYKRDAADEGTDLSVKLDANTGEVTINLVLHVVDYVDEEGPPGQVMFDEARQMSPEAEVGGSIVVGDLEFTPHRIASRATSQFLKQRLRAAERQIVFDQYADKQGEMISAPVRRIESNRDRPADTRPTVIVDLGKADAYLPDVEQPDTERYRPGMDLKYFVVRVSSPSDENDDRPEIIVSRSHPDLLRRLMESEVPEIKSGLVEIKRIARDPGVRSKVAVSSNRRDVDPIGACVGLRGIRVQNVVTELMGEKIDILEWSEDINTYITNALSPASVDKVTLLQGDSAEVVVPDSAYSLAIGRGGENVNLAARLTGTYIDIKMSSQYAEEQLLLQRQLEEAEVEARAAEQAKAEEEAKAAAVAEAAEAEVVAEVEEVPEAVAVVEEAVDEVPVAEVSVEEEVAEVEAPEPEAQVEPPAPKIFMPSGPLTQVQAPPDEEPAAEDESDADLALELEELEEQIRELEVKEQERLEAAREAQERADLDQFINSDEIWAVPGELEDEEDDASSGLKFAEDIAGFRDSDSERAPRRGSGRRGGPRSSRR